MITIMHSLLRQISALNNPKGVDMPLNNQGFVSLSNGISNLVGYLMLNLVKELWYYLTHN